MNDMECPYCGDEWEHDIEDFRYTAEEGEYECPSCERIFIMSGELVPEFFGETVEEYYERRIIHRRDVVEFYKNKINQYIERGDNDRAEHYKTMLDMYYLPYLRKEEEALERCVEHNKKVGEVDD